MTARHSASLPDRAPLYEMLFYFILPCTVALFFVGGSYLKTIPPSPLSHKSTPSKITTRFIIKEEKKPAIVRKEVKKVSVKKNVVPVEKPVDLTAKPVLKQKENSVAPKQAAAAGKVRRVYGLRKVYSRGLGTGGSLSDAVVAKLGNTINKEIDTITATTSDIKGRIASTTTVTTPPRFKNRSKPAYTDEMKEHQVAGKVKAKVLVDVDGKAKKIIITHDLGYGTKEASIEAINKMMFEPAKINDDPVAVWIPVTFRFEFRA